MATKSMFSRATALLAAASMAASGLVATPAFATGADPANNIDQQPVGADGVGLDCSLDAYPGGVLVNTGSSDDSEATTGLLTGTTQTFTPSIGNVSSIDLCLSVVIGGDEANNLLSGQVSDLFTFDVAVYTGDAPTSEDVVTRTTAELSLLEVTSGLGLDAAWFNVQLLDANLQPGSPYTIEITDPSVTFVWRTTCGGDLPTAPSCEGAADAYPEGASGADAAADHGFRTYFEIGGNLVADVLAKELICPELDSLDHVRVTVQNGDVGVAPFEVDLELVDGEARTLLGTATVDRLSAYEGAVLSPDDFGIDPATLAAAAAVDDSSSRRVSLVATADARGVITETDELDNVATAGVTLVPCGPSELSPIDLVVDEGQAAPTLEHGIINLPFDSLTPADIALGATDLNTVSTYLAEGEDGQPVYASPAYASPAYASPAYASPAYASPAYASPAYASPAYASPAYASPAYASPAYASPAYASPAYASPAYASPAYASPAYASPAYASNVATLFQSLDDDILRQIPLVAVPANPGWVDRLDAYRELYPSQASVVDSILGMPDQDRTLFDVLRRLDPPLVANLNDLDFSRILPLNMLTVGMANIQLGDFRYDRTPGIANECEMLVATSHLTCQDIIDAGLVPAQTTLLQLSLFGYDFAAFPLALEPVQGLHDLRLRDVVVDGETYQQTDNILFDTYLANVGHLELAEKELVDLGDLRAYAKLRHTPHGQELISKVFTDPSEIVDCASEKFSCDADTTIADVELAFHFRQDATVADFVDALSPDGAELFTIGDTLLSLHSFINLPLGQFGIDQLDLTRLTGNSCPAIPMHLDATSVGVAPVVDPTYTVELARGWDPLLDSVEVLLDGVPADVVGDVSVAPKELAEGEVDPKFNVLTIQLDAIVTGDVRVSFQSCASVELGAWNTLWTAVEYPSFVSATDLTIEDQQPIGDALVGTVEVVEQTEPDEGSDSASRRIQPNSMIHRHITGATDVDQFVVGIGSDLGNGVVLEEGDFVHFFMAPPKMDLTYDPETEEYVPVGNTDFDLALFVGGPSPIVDSLFGENPDPQYGSLGDEETILALSSPETGLDSPYTTLQASPAYASPAYASPAYASPAYASPAYASPAYASPAYASPARLLSNGRGDQIEHVFTEILPGWGADTQITIQVSGNLGANSDEPYVLWYFVQKSLAEPIVCVPPYGDDFASSLDPAGQVPTLAPGVESLIVYNEDLYRAQYGDVAASELRGALDLLAADEAVNGVVVDLMDDPSYRAATIEHLTTASWCEPESANRIHGAGRSVVQALADQTIGPDGEPTLEYVVVLGGDDMHPFARLKDTTTLAHELEHFASIASKSGTWNPLTAAHAGGFMLSDDPMVTRNPRPWMDEFLWLPNQVSSRVYGSPMDAMIQIGTFLAPSGAGKVVDVDTALVAGEDFLADGASDVADFLRSLGVTIDDSLLNVVGTPYEELSTAADLFEAIDNDAAEGEEPTYPGLSLLFQHADESNVQSAQGTAGRFADLTSTADYEGRSEAYQGQEFHFGQVVAGTVCHFGEDIPRSYLSGSSILPGGASGSGEETWSAVLGRDSVNSYLIAHTSYGYGVSEGRDLSEELVNLITEFATVEGLSWGQATVAAKTLYYATSSEYGEHQRKAISTLTGSGMPWVTSQLPETASSTTQSFDAEFTALNTTSTSEPTPGIVSPTFEVDPVTGLQVTDLVTPSLPLGRPGCDDCLAKVTVGHVENGDGGVYYEANWSAGLGGSEGREGRPIGPKTTTVYDLDPGQVIGGVIVTGIESTAVPGLGGDDESVDFVNATTHVSSTLNEAPVNALDVATGGPFANVRRADGDTYITLPRYSARGVRVTNDVFGPDVLGSYRLDTAFEGDVYLRDPNAPEVQAPFITDLDVVSIPRVSADFETIGVTLTAMDQSDIARVVVGMLVEGRWYFKDLGLSSSTSGTGAGGDFTTARFSTGFDFPDVQGEVIIDSLVMYVLDEWGTVATDEVKGQRVADLDGQVNNPGDDPTIEIVGETTEGWYVGETDVLIIGEPFVTYEITIDGVKQVVTFGADGTFTYVEDESGYHEVRARRFGGDAEAVAIFAVDNSDPEVFLLTPNEAAPEVPTYVSGSIVAVETLCRDAGGGVADDDCVVDPANTLDGEGLFLDTTRVTEGPDPIITARATDLVGNTASTSAAFRVISAFAFNGFFDPVKIVVDENGVETQQYVASGENTIPFKFEYLTRDGEPIGKDGTLSFYWTAIGLGGVAIQNETPTSCDAISKPGYRYTNGQHIFNAVTSCLEYEFASGDIWRFTVEAPDGLKIQADVIFP